MISSCHCQRRLNWNPILCLEQQIEAHSSERSLGFAHVVCVSERQLEEWVLHNDDGLHAIRGNTSGNQVPKYGHPAAE
jgi:hypothetical protein